MIKIEKTDVLGWEAAIRGMRNPMNSWGKSDSWKFTRMDAFTQEHLGVGVHIGENDLKLMSSLSKTGNDHAKFLRMINVTCDITAPLYWWKEFDTYKVGTVANSCSTMHTIHKKEFTLDDFSHEHLANSKSEYLDSMGILKEVINMMNLYRERFVKTNDKRYWWQMIQLLPSSYNQKRTVQLNYAVTKNIYFSRQNHKLDEWREFCSWIETLPYFKEIVINE